MLIAFKTWGQKENRPQGIPTAIPWQSFECLPEKRIELESQEFTVVSQEQYSVYLESIQTDIDYWVSLNSKSAQYKQQEEQRVWAESKIKGYIDRLGEKNLQIAASGQTVDMMAIASTFASFDLLFRSGALKTSIGICNAVIAQNGPYTQLFTDIKNEIVDFLTEKGWL